MSSILATVQGFEPWTHGFGDRRSDHAELHRYINWLPLKGAGVLSRRLQPGFKVKLANVTRLELAFSGRQPGPFPDRIHIRICYWLCWLDSNQRYFRKSLVNSQAPCHSVTPEQITYNLFLR